MTRSCLRVANLEQGDMQKAVSKSCCKEGYSPRYEVSVYMTISTLVFISAHSGLV